MKRTANHNQFNNMWRVFFKQESPSGFNVGNMESVGMSDFATEEKALEAVKKWESS